MNNQAQIESQRIINQQNQQLGVIYSNNNSNLQSSTSFVNQGNNKKIVGNVGGDGIGGYNQVNSSK